MKDYNKLLTKNGVRVPDEAVIDVCWKARFNDWYCKTQSGWFWYDHGERAWKGCSDPS
jgi:hypothetical protein